MSKFILAALIFSVINVSLFSLAPLSVGLFQKNAGHRRIIDGLVSIEKMPDVLCLGSSIIRLPLWMCDFCSNKDTPAYNRFFQVKSFENYLKEKYKCNRTIANAALDGAMISDDYFFVRKAINDKHRPKMIILCVAPRDFADSLYPDETQTVTFSCLFNANDLILNDRLFCISMVRRAEALGRQIFFLQDNEDRFKSWMTSFISKLANRACLAKLSAPENADNPLLVSQPKTKSMREYRLRYRDLNFAQVERQSVFFEKLVDYCSSLQIPIIVVNMPLTEENKNLLPENFYSRYLAYLKSLCRAKNVSLINLADEHFSEADFYDTAHLNDRGGQALISKLSMVIASKDLRPTK